MHLKFFLLLGLTPLSSAKLLRRWDDFAEKHSWPEVPQGWEYRAAAPQDHTFELRIGLKQHRIEELIENLLEISDPSHERFAPSQLCDHKFIWFLDMVSI